MSDLGSFEYDDLIGGDKKLVTESVLVASGNLKRGAVVGKVNTSTPTTGTAAGGNTGNGTVTAVEGRRDLKIGTYTVECTASATNSGTFKVTNPNGDDIQTGIEIPAGAGHSVEFSNDELAGKITDGSTDFAVGDIFTVAVTIAERQVKLLDKGASDGSKDPYGVLAEDVDASSGKVASVVYLEGEFNERSLTFATGTDIEDVRDGMRTLGMIAVPSVKN